MQEFVTTIELIDAGPPRSGDEVDAVTAPAGIRLPGELVRLYGLGDGGRLNASWVESATAVAPGEPDPGLNCPIEELIPLTGDAGAAALRAEMTDLGHDVAGRWPFARRGSSYSYWYDSGDGSVVRFKPRRPDLVRGAWLHFAPDVPTFLAGLNTVNGR